MRPASPTLWPQLIGTLSVAAFAVAMNQPAFSFGASGTSSGPAWKLLLEGWQALPHGYIEWCANPALLLSWLAQRSRPRLSLAAAIIAVALMLFFLTRRGFVLPGMSATQVITSHGPGYWLWLGSGLLMVVAAASTVRK